MPQIKQITTYKYNELDEKAKAKARQWFLESSYSDQWWDSTYEDAARIGLKITSFDLDRNRHAKGEFDGGMLYANDCAEKILEEHGENCGTYKTAKQFIADRAGLIAELENYQAEEVEELEAYEILCQEFLKSLIEDYSIMLQKESEYMSSDEYLEEGITANDYDFLANGEIA